MAWERASRNRGLERRAGSAAVVGGGAALAARGLLVLAAILALGGAGAARAQEVMGVAGLGAFAVRPDEGAEFLIDLEYRLPPRKHGISPVIGAAATSVGATYVRAGFGRDFPLGSRWTTHLGFAGNLYFEGDAGKRLGGALEFRSVIDLSYRVAPDLRVGVALAHLSNGGLGRFNPGVETLCLTFAWRQPPRLRRALP